MFGDHGLSQAFGGFNMAQAMGGQQAGNLQGMANDVMGAINQENQSRVAQQREQQRMQHEKDLEQMRMNTLIGRLGQSTPGFWK